MIERAFISASTTLSEEIALMFEPRGHHDMFGVFVVEPCNKEADFGVFFMDGGDTNMCVSTHE